MITIDEILELTTDKQVTHWRALLLAINPTPSPSGIILRLYPGGISPGYEVAMRFRFTQYTFYLHHLLKTPQQ